MPNTTNFNWPTPADTDLVKDGAAAIRNLGDGVDTSLVDLKGGTTGQILSKASNADMDFVFITPNVGDLTEVQAGTGISVADGTGPIPIVTNTMATEITAKGDLIVGTGSGTFDNLPAGTNGFTLVADSSTATGLAYAAPAAAAGMTLVKSQIIGSAVSSVQVTSAFSATYDFYKIVIAGGVGSLADITLRLTFGASTSDYYSSVALVGWNGATEFNGSNNNAAYLNRMGAAQTDSINMNIDVNNPFAAKFTYVYGAFIYGGDGGIVTGVHKSAVSYTSFTVTPDQGTLTGGTIYVYGYKNS